MADEKLNPIEQIAQHIKARNNFVLNGGAGSGKTKTLIDVLDLLYSIDPACKIACITFTNVAADEISDRVANKNIQLRASTIHDFFWDIIKNYQKNIKQALIELIDSGAISYKGEEKLNNDWFKGRTIDYLEWRKIEDGIISHNEVLLLANKLFQEFPLIRKILKDKYDVVLIDEYQDTEKPIIEIFLNYLQENKGDFVVGFFGDSMQAIYNNGIGDLSEYVSTGTVREVQKEDNWRCSKNVIDLINKIRNDGLEQKSAGDNIDGKISFLYSNTDQFDIQEIKKHAVFDDFDFGNVKENKELYLTHKLIATQFGFKNILDKYKYTDNLMGDNPDRLAKHLLKIQEIIHLYKNRHFNEFIKKTDYKIINNSDLKGLKDSIEQLTDCAKKSIEEAINLADELKLVIIDDRLENFISEYEEQYNAIKDLSYGEIVNVYNYKNEHSPYSTQHGVKGAEFDNVFVSLDNGRWNQYNFTYLFEGTLGKESIIERTRKMFYVSCSRAKKNLVVFFPKPSATVLAKAKEWFGELNVVKIQ